MYAKITNRLKHLSRLQSGISSGLIKSSGSVLTTKSGIFTDFYSGAGQLNYGHQNQVLLRKLNTDIRRNGILGTGRRTQSIRKEFLQTFKQLVLKPRRWEYLARLAGPSGACALESALNTARQITGRQAVIAFSEGFHGVNGLDLASAAQKAFASVTGNSNFISTTFMPYDRCLGPDLDTMVYLEQWLNSLSDPSKVPAAVVVETVLGQGGVNVLTWRWLKDLEQLCKRHGIMLILDDTQVGCGRAGRFFSFEAANVQPDIVVLTKSLSGFGLPMSMLLVSSNHQVSHIKSGSCWSAALDYDVALLSATHALEVYWLDDSFADQVQRKECLVRDWLENIVSSYPGYGFSVRGRGLIQGLVMPEFGHGLAQAVARQCFKNGVLLDTSGINEEVLKLMPALTIENDLLIKGLEIIETSLAEVLSSNQTNIRNLSSNNGDS